MEAEQSNHNSQSTPSGSRLGEEGKDENGGTQQITLERDSVQIFRSQAPSLRSDEAAGPQGDDRDAEGDLVYDRDDEGNALVQDSKTLLQKLAEGVQRRIEKERLDRMRQQQDIEKKLERENWGSIYCYINNPKESPDFQEQKSDVKKNENFHGADTYKNYPNLKNMYDGHKKQENIENLPINSPDSFENNYSSVSRNPDYIKQRAAEIAKNMTQSSKCLTKGRINYHSDNQVQKEAQAHGLSNSLSQHQLETFNKQSNLSGGKDPDFDTYLKDQHQQFGKHGSASMARKDPGSPTQSRQQGLDPSTISDHQDTTKEDEDASKLVQNLSVLEVPKNFTNKRITQTQVRSSELSKLHTIASQSTHGEGLSSRMRSPREMRKEMHDQHSQLIKDYSEYQKNNLRLLRSNANIVFQSPSFSLQSLNPIDGGFLQEQQQADQIEKYRAFERSKSYAIAPTVQKRQGRMASGGLTKNVSLREVFDLSKESDQYMASGRYMKQWSQTPAHESNQISFANLPNVPNQIQFSLKSQISRRHQSLSGHPEPNYIYQPPEKQFVQSPKSLSGYKIRDEGDKRNIKFLFQNKDPLELDDIERFIQNKYQIDMHQKEIKEAIGKHKERYASIQPKTRSTRTLAEKEVFGMISPEKQRSRMERLADQVGIKYEKNNEKISSKNEYGGEKKKKRAILSIFDIKTRVDREVAEGIIHAEADDVEAEANLRQKERFNELNGDYQQKEKYTNKNIDTSADTMPEIQGFQQELVEKLMGENIIIKENPHSILSKKAKKKLEPKVEQILLRQLEQSKIKRPFEKMTSLLGVNTKQYIAIQHFERFYKTHKNCGLDSIEKNNDLVLAKELFACWDQDRRGIIDMQDLAEYLISFGLALSKDQVVKLIQSISSQKGSPSQQITEITMKDFIKIFERDTFGDKATDLIKQECVNAKQQQAALMLAKAARNRSHGGSRISDSDLQSMSAMSKGSKVSGARASIYSTRGGSRWGGTSAGGGGYVMSNLEIKPAIQDQIAITKDWWQSFNPNQDVFLPVLAIKKFLIQKKLAHDLDMADKEIVKYLGQVEQMEYAEFYKLFCKGIFRVALQDLLYNIEELSKDREELPLILKLAAYRRNLMLCGLDKQDTELKDRGKQILYAMKIYKDQINPQMFKNLDFQQFILDPLGKNKKMDADKIERERLQNFQKTVNYAKVKERGKLMDVNVEEIEKVLKGEDDETMREILKELQEEKKGHQFKAVQKFDIEKMNLQVIAEQDLEDYEVISGSEGDPSSDENDLQLPKTKKYLKKGQGQKRQKKSKRQENRPSNARSPAERSPRAEPNVPCHGGPQQQANFSNATEGVKGRKSPPPLGAFGEMPRLSTLQPEEAGALGGALGSRRLSVKRGAAGGVKLPAITVTQH